MITMADYADILLAEYDQLKREQHNRIRTRDTLFVSMLAVIAALAGATTQTGHYELLLLLPPAAAIIGWTYLANDQKITALGDYIRNHLAKQLSAEVDGNPVFGWEICRHDPRRATRKRFQLAADLLAFCGAPFLALAIYSQLGAFSFRTISALAVELFLCGVMG